MINESPKRFFMLFIALNNKNSFLVLLDAFLPRYQHFLTIYFLSSLGLRSSLKLFETLFIQRCLVLIVNLLFR